MTTKRRTFAEHAEAIAAEAAAAEAWLAEHADDLTREAVAEWITAEGNLAEWPAHWPGYSPDSAQTLTTYTADRIEEEDNRVAALRALTTPFKSGDHAERMRDLGCRRYGPRTRTYLVWNPTKGETRAMAREVTIAWGADLGTEATRKRTERKAAAARKPASLADRGRGFAAAAARWDEASLADRLTVVRAVGGSVNDTWAVVRAAAAEALGDRSGKGYSIADAMAQHGASGTGVSTAAE